MIPGHLCCILGSAEGSHHGLHHSCRCYCCSSCCEQLPGPLRRTGSMVALQWHKGRQSTLLNQFGWLELTVTLFHAGHSMLWRKCICTSTQACRCRRLALHAKPVRCCGVVQRRWQTAVMPAAATGHQNSRHATYLEVLTGVANRADGGDSIELAVVCEVV